MKTCCTCKVEKTLEDFNLRQNKKTLCSECRICCAKRSNDWYWKNREKSLGDRKKRYEETREETLIKAKERYIRNHEEIRKKANERNRTEEQRKKQNERVKKWNKENPERLRERVRNYAKKNPEKKIAQQHILWALRLNVMKKPDHCSECNSLCRIEAHHEDYSKPLDVVWLCKLCHAKRHRRMA